MKGKLAAFANFMVDAHKRAIKEFQAEASAHDGKASVVARQQPAMLKRQMHTAQSLQKTG